MPAIIFLFSNLYPFFIENSVNFSKQYNIYQLYESFNIKQIINNLKTFFSSTVYLMKLFVPLSTMFDDHLSSFFGPKNGHIHGTFPSFFSSLFFIIFLLFFFKYKKNFIFYILVFFIFASLPGFFQRIIYLFTHEDSSQFIFIIGIIFLLINLNKSQIRSFANILKTRTLEDNLKYLKYTLLLLIISLFFYIKPGIQQILLHYPNHLHNLSYNMVNLNQMFL